MKVSLLRVRRVLIEVSGMEFEDDPVEDSATNRSIIY